jgi:alkyldihydroxyacetonephosphate synthase
VTILELDTQSLLVHASAHAEVADVERELRQKGLTLGVSPEGSVGAWLGDGAPGAPSAWLDPADHLVAGWTARRSDGSGRFTVHPAPRRAVGPDLLALVLGMKGRFLVLESAWLRVHRVDTPRAMTEPFTDDAAPLNDDERALLDAIDAVL